MNEQTARECLQTLSAAALVEAATGRLDLNAVAIDELAARGLDPQTGEWVGFDKARGCADAARDRLGIL